MPLRIPAAIAVVALASGCSAVPSPVERAPVAREGCRAAKDPLHPLIVDWSATNRVSLDAASRRGGVAVAFDGCGLVVVRGCEVRGQYRTTSVRPERRAIVMHDRDDVLGWLPMAPPAVGAQIGGGKSLVLDLVVTKERSLDAGGVELEGDCSAATHYVKRVRLGAFTLETKADAEAAVHADVGPLSAGGSHDERDARSKASGNPDACAASPEDAGCDAPVSLELAPLPSSAPRPGSETMMMRDR